MDGADLRAGPMALRLAGGRLREIGEDAPVPLLELLDRVPGSALVRPTPAFLSDAFAIGFTRLHRRAHAAGLRRVEDEMQSMHEQIKTEGRAEGRAEGKIEGKAETLLLLLRERFGRIPAEVETRIHAATPGQLDDRLRAVLKADRLDDIFGRRPVH